MSLSINTVLKHIRDELYFLVTDSANYDYESFTDDRKTILSYTRSLEIIGEASKNVPDHFRKQYPQVDWKGFAGLRDIIIHQYFGIDYEAIWEIVSNEVPQAYHTIVEIIQIIENK